MKFNPEEYEPVEERIKRFYADHEDGTIITEVLNEDISDMAVVKATVMIADKIRSTGLAVEIRDKELQKSKKGYEYESVNYTSWLENAETSAIGRALANFNYTGSKRPSREEMEKVDRMTNNPKPQSKPQNTEQTDSILSRLRASGLDENEKINLEKQYIQKPDGAKPAFAKFIEQRIGR